MTALDRRRFGWGMTPLVVDLADDGGATSPDAGEAEFNEDAFLAVEDAVGAVAVKQEEDGEEGWIG